jgi:hypothetical protein
MLFHNLFSKLMVNHLFYPFFTSELQKPESVSSVFPLGEGTNASFTQILCNEGFLPSSVGNSLNTQPADS